MTGRSFTSLAALADEVARMVGGTAHVLDASEYGSASIALDGWHRVLVREHARTFGVSLPHTSSWQLWNADTLAAMAEGLRTALRAPRTIAIADAVVSFAPLLQKRTGSAWHVRFPGGSPIPGEGWMEHGERRLGIFQDPSAIRLWVCGTGMLEQTVRLADELPALAPWLEDALGRQDLALEAQRREKLRKDARPLPDYEAVVLALKNGTHIRVGVGRWSQTFFWDRGLKHTVFDEGLTYDPADVGEEELRAAIDRYPDVFRKALGMPG